MNSTVIGTTGETTTRSNPEKLPAVLSFVAVAAVTLALSVRLLRFVDRYSADVLFWDQWDFLDPLFRHSGIWTMWRWQHGPHRQGMGGIILAVVAAVSNWNARAFAFTSGAIAVVAAAAALVLARALRGRWSPWDIAVPLIVLTVSQDELLVVTPNPAIGPTTVLLLVLFAGCLLIKRTNLRLALLAIVFFVMEQTGYTFLFAGIAVPLFCVLLARAVQEKRHIGAHVLALLASFLSVAFFVSGLSFTPGGDGCFQFPDPHPSRYVVFLGSMFLRPFEIVRRDLRWAGIALAAVCVAVTVVSGWRTLRTRGRDQLGATVFCLAGFSALSAGMAAIGRSCIGPDAGTASRYVTYVVPFLLATYLWLSVQTSLGKHRAAILLSGCVLLTAKEVVFTHARSEKEAAVWVARKQEWRECYLSRADPIACNTKCEIHPNPFATHMPEKLDFMRLHGLSLFRPEAEERRFNISPVGSYP